MAKAAPIRGLSSGTPLGSAAPRILSARVGDVEKHEAALPEVDAVHDMRVAARRLRGALRLLGLREHDAKVKKLQDALGEVRDLQLQVEWLKERDPELSAKRSRLLEDARTELSRALGEWHSRTLPPLLLPANLRGKLGGHAVRKRLRKRLKRFEERLERALGSMSPKAMHEVRISVKQLRYLFELVEEAFPDISAKLLQDLEPLQAVLGELHDADVRVELLERHRRKELAREQKDEREHLAKIADAELSRWKTQDIAGSARKRLK